VSVLSARPQRKRGFFDATVPWEAMGQRDYPTDVAKRYAPPYHAVADSVTDPSPLSEDQRPDSSGDGPPLSDAEPSNARIADHARARRALEELVHLRTLGVVSVREYRSLTARLESARSKVSLDETKRATPPIERLRTLHADGVITRDELLRLSKRLVRSTP
jgi:hypothetical protein